MVRNSKNNVCPHCGEHFIYTQFRKDRIRKQGYCGIACRSCGKMFYVDYIGYIYEKREDLMRYNVGDYIMVRTPLFLTDKTFKILEKESNAMRYKCHKVGDAIDHFYWFNERDILCKIDTPAINKNEDGNLHIDKNNIKQFYVGDIVAFRDEVKKKTDFKECKDILWEIIHLSYNALHDEYIYDLRKYPKDSIDNQYLTKNYKVNAKHDELIVLTSDLVNKITEADRVSYSGGYIYKVGDRIRFCYEDAYSEEARLKVRTGIIEDRRGYRYVVVEEDSKKEIVIEKEWIIGYAANRDAMEKYVENNISAVKEFINKYFGIKKENKNMNVKKRNRNLIVQNGNYKREIKEVMFNGPATIIKWQPTVDQYACGTKGDKTVSVCKDGDKYDMTTGFLLAVIKEFVDNKSYDNILRKIESFEAFDIPPVGKDDEEEIVYKFKVGDIVRVKKCKATFEVTKQTFWTFGDKVVRRYRLKRTEGSMYTTYENESRLELVK